MNPLSLLKKLNPRQIANLLVPLACLCIGWFLHHPAKESIDNSKSMIVDKTDYKKVQQLNEQIASLSAEIETLRKHTHIVEREIRHPDGTIEKTKIFDQKVAKATQNTQSQTVDRQQVATEAGHSDHSVAETHERRIITSPRNWNLGPMVAVNPLSPLSSPLYGGLAERRLGTIPLIDVDAWAGIFAVSNLKTTYVGVLITGQF